jgi:hypothetical protein
MIDEKKLEERLVAESDEMRRLIRALRATTNA